MFLILAVLLLFDYSGLKEPGHIETHQQTSIEARLADMLLCNPAIKQPTAALMQPYRIHPIGQIPYRNPAISGTGTD